MCGTAAHLPLPSLLPLPNPCLESYSDKSLHFQILQAIDSWLEKYLFVTFLYICMVLAFLRDFHYFGVRTFSTIQSFSLTAAEETKMLCALCMYMQITFFNASMFGKHGLRLILFVSCWMRFVSFLLLVTNWTSNYYTADRGGTGTYPCL